MATLASSRACVTGGSAGMRCGRGVRPRVYGADRDEGAMANLRPCKPRGLGGEIGRRAGLKIPFREECRFDSDPRHHRPGSTRMTDPAHSYPTIEDTIGQTPMVRLVRILGAGNEARGNVVL